MPIVEMLPGADSPNVYSIQDVLDAEPALGHGVVLLDDLGDWRGVGTAVHLAERGHDVTLVTAASVVGGALYHSTADVPLRRRFAEAGGRSLTETVVTAWGPDGATVRSSETGATNVLPADALVLAETPVSEVSLAIDLAARGIAFHLIGDAVAPRRASLAIYEGRDLARRL